MVFPVGNVDPAVLVGGDVMGDVELARIGARLAPGKQELAVGAILMHSGIAVAIGDVEIAVARVDGDMGAAVEWIATHEGGGLAACPQREQDSAVERRSEEHTSELQSLRHLVCRLL